MTKLKVFVVIYGYLYALPIGRCSACKAPLKASFPGEFQLALDQCLQVPAVVAKNYQLQSVSGTHFQRSELIFEELPKEQNFQLFRCEIGIETMVYSSKIRDFRKARKTQHQNSEFVPKPGEIKQKPAKNPVSFFLSASTAAA
jgi:hypothetical protein